MIMDAFSETIIKAVEAVKFAVVKIERITSKNNKELVAGNGSGFMISSDGYLFTNSHVIHGAKKLRVVLHDGSMCPAELVGEDTIIDLAILKISSNDSYEKEIFFCVRFYYRPFCYSKF